MFILGVIKTEQFIDVWWRCPARVRIDTLGINIMCLSNIPPSGTKHHTKHFLVS